MSWWWPVRYQNVSVPMIRRVWSFYMGEKNAGHWMNVDVLIVPEAGWPAKKVILTRSRNPTARCVRQWWLLAPRRDQLGWNTSRRRSGFQSMDGRGTKTTGAGCAQCQLQRHWGSTVRAPPPGLPLVSANIVGETISPYVLIEAGPHTIGITGITTPGMSFLEPENYQITDPIKGLDPSLKKWTRRPISSSCWPMAMQSSEKAGRIRKVDVVIDTHLHRENYPPVFVGGALWVRSHFQTMRLGELRLGIEDGGDRLGP